MKNLQKNRATVFDYVDVKKPACTPPPSWWVKLLAIHAVATEITSAVKSLQELSTLLNEQKSQIEGFIQSLMSL